MSEKGMTPPAVQALLTGDLRSQSLRRRSGFAVKERPIIFSAGQVPGSMGVAPRRRLVGRQSVLLGQRAEAEQ